MLFAFSLVFVFELLFSNVPQIEEVTHLQPVPDAYVLVMKFKFHGISDVNWPSVRQCSSLGS
jgi:poly(A) polymerase Pap1